MLTTLVLMMAMACGGDEGESENTNNEVAEQQSPIDLFTGKFKAKIDRGSADEAFASIVNEIKSVAGNEDAWHILVNVGTQASTDVLAAHIDKIEGDASRVNLVKFLIQLQRGSLDEAVAIAATEENAERSKAMRTLALLRKGALEGDVFSVGASGDDWVAKWAIAAVSASAGDKSAANALYTELTTSENRFAKLHGHYGLALGHASSSGRIENAGKALELAFQTHDVFHIAAGSVALAEAMGGFDQGDQYDEKIKGVFDIEKYLSKSDMLIVGTAIASGYSASGDHYNALRLLKNAREKLPDGDAKSKVAMSEALTAFYLRDAAAISAALPANSVENQLIVGLLHKASLGEMLPGGGELLRSLPPKDLLQVTLSLGESDIQAFNHLYDSALSAAKSINSAVSELDLALIRESNQREVSGIDTSLELDAIDAAYGAAFPNLKSETSLRRFLLTGQKPSSDGFGGDGLTGAWGAYFEQKLPTSKSGAAVALAGMSLLRKSHESGKGYKKAVNALWSNLPIHRQGALSLGTVLDGSHGLRGMDTVAELVGATDPQKVASALILSEQNRRRTNFRSDYSKGGNLIFGMAPANRGLLLKATHRAKQAIRGFWAGGKDPASSLDALAGVETKLTSKKDGDDAYKAIKLHKNVDLKALYEILNNYAILSYAQHGQDLLGIVISPESASIKNLGAIGDVESIISQQHELLVSGSLDRKVFKPRSKSHKVGNSLNLKLLGPFSGNVLSGYGRYVVIAPDHLLKFSLSVLPDQQDGLLFLQDKRIITSSTGLAEMLRSAPELGSFSPDVYAVSKPDMPELKKDEDDLFDVSQRTIPTSYAVIRSAAFEKSRTVMLVGKKAKLETYAQSAGAARYISFSGMKSSETGGFIMADGELTLSQIAQQPLLATVVFLDYDANHAHQMKRVRAFLNAGARSVMVGAWELDEKNVRSMMVKVFDSLNRDRPIHKSFQSGRKDIEKSVAKELKFLGSSALAKNATNNPGVWGAFHLFGRSSRD